MHKLKNVLLVDDDEITNYINSDLIRALDITENISVATNGQEAIDYIEKAYTNSKNNVESKENIIPDLILLDINMPVMNGFEFLREYDAKFGGELNTTVITMLTTSFIKDEVAKALSMNQIVQGYIEKPLTDEIVMEIYNSHFNK
jgi:CheY-like chemotaxis protein